MDRFFNNVWTSLTDFADTLGDSAGDILYALIKIIGIIILARIVIVVLQRIFKRILSNRARRNPQSDKAKKAETIQAATKSAIKYTVYFFAATAILGVLGLGTAVSSLLAAAGIGGIVIAFGAQSLVKDVFSGLFMLFENQYTVGDFIEIDGEKGTVVTVSLRTTSIKKFTGETATIPNGNISKVINYSRGDNLAIIDISVSYDTDIETASQIMQTMGLEYMAKHDNIIEEPHVLGIIDLADSGIVLRMIMRVQPLTHWETERSLRKMIVEEYARQNVQIPYPHLVVIND